MVSAASLLTLNTTTRTMARAATGTTAADAPSVGKAGKGTAAPPAAAAAASPSPAPSAKKDFATVAQEARAALDASYEARGGAGDMHTTGKEWAGIMQGMDRRTLYAVFSNAGGQFSEAERGAAEGMMEADYMRGIGLDPDDPMAGAKMSQDPAGFAKAGVAFLESVSDEEKQSVRWAYARAGHQRGYEMMAGRDGGPVEDLSSDNPLVKVITAALRGATGDPSRDRSEGRMDTLEGLLNQPWARGWEQQLKQAAAQGTGDAGARQRGGLVNSLL